MHKMAPFLAALSTVVFRFDPFYKRERRPFPLCDPKRYWVLRRPTVLTVHASNRNVYI